MYVETHTPLRNCRRDNRLFMDDDFVDGTASSQVDHEQVC